MIFQQRYLKIEYRFVLKTYLIKDLLSTSNNETLRYTCVTMYKLIFLDTKPSCDF